MAYSPIKKSLSFSRYQGEPFSGDESLFHVGFSRLLLYSDKLVVKRYILLFQYGKEEIPRASITGVGRTFRKFSERNFLLSKLTKFGTAGTFYIEYKDKRNRLRILLCYPWLIHNWKKWSEEWIGAFIKIGVKADEPASVG